MKITKAVSDSRKREFRITTETETLAFPYPKARLSPTPSDPVAEVFPDSELGCEAFTYRLESGQEDTIHLDAVREVNLDPDYLQELMLHQLTVEAKKGLDSSGLGIRQVARQMKTSPAQVYRLLDPTNRAKSLGQLLFLLHLVDRRVEVSVSAPRKRR